MIGMCTLISLPQRPAILHELAPKVMPALVLLFDGLKRAYAARAQEMFEEEDSDSEGGEIEDSLSSDEDDIEDKEYLDTLSRKTTNALTNAGFQVNATIQDAVDDSNDDDDSDFDLNEEMVLEAYTTPLDEEDCEVDEYIVFKEVMTQLEANQTEWYHVLMMGLTEAQNGSLMEICVLADQRRAAKESKKIEQQGGQ